MRRFMLALIAGVLIASATTAYAFTLYPVRYSGSLTEGGVPANGKRWFQFDICDNAVGGVTLYSQPESLMVLNGIFHTSFPTSSGLWNGSDRWVATRVNGGAELSPRVMINWVPYAVKANTADSTKVAAGAAGFYITVGQPIPNTTWVVVGSVGMPSTVPGFAVVTFNGIIVGGSTQRMVGEISIGTPGNPGQGPIQRFALTPGSGGNTELPVTLTRMLPVVVGDNSFYVRNTDNFFGSFQAIQVGTTLIYVPKYAGY